MKYALFIALLLSGCGEETSVPGHSSATMSLEWYCAPSSLEIEPWFGGALTIDVANGYLYVSDARRIQAFILTEYGGFSGYIGRTGEGPGEYRRLMGIGASPTGRVYVVSENVGQLLGYDAGGEFIERISHLGVLSRCPFSVSRPIVVSDSLFVYNAGPRVAFPSVEEAKDIPVALLVNESTYRPLGSRVLHESFEAKRITIASGLRDNLYYRLTVGHLRKGRDSGELVFIKYCDPFQIHVLDTDGSERDFRFVFSRPSEEWLIVIADIPREIYKKYEIGLHNKIFIGTSPITNTNNILTYQYQLCGTALYDDILYILMKAIDPNALPSLIESAVLYGLNLESEQLELTLKIEDPRFAALHGITSDGMFITSFDNPQPGLASWRIRPSP